MQERLDGGEVTAAGIELQILARGARVDGDLRAVAIPVSPRTSEREPEEIVMRQPLDPVLEDEGGPVEIVDHEVQVAVVVQVGVRRPGGVTRDIHPPRHRAIAERQVAVVPEEGVGELAPRPLAQPREQSLLALPLETLAAGLRQVARAHLPHEGEIVEVGNVLRIAVGDEKVLPPIIVVIRKEGSPAPIRRVHSGELSDLAEGRMPVRPRAVVELQRVPHVLGLVAEPPAHLELVVGLPGEQQLAAQVVGRKHVEDHDVDEPVVIDVRHIRAHRGEALMLQILRCQIGKRPVTVVDPHQVVREEVVGHVHVGPAIAIQVGDGHAETVSLGQDAGLARHVAERAVAVVAVQPIGARRLPVADLGSDPVSVVGLERILKDVKIEKSIPVVVEEHGVGVVAGIGDAESPCLFYEPGRAVLVRTLVDEQQVAALRRNGAAHREIEIRQPVLIDIHHGDAADPHVGADTRGLGDVLETEMPPVQVQAARDHVAGEVDIRQPVVVHVGDRHAAAVVQVVEIDDVVEGVVLS